MDTGNLHPAQSTQRRWLWLIVGCVALVPLLIVVIVVADRTSPLNRVPAAAPTPSASPTADPWRAALATLHAQAAALVRRDEQGWLAAVDPAAPHTRALFQQRFAALAALDVSQFSYQSGIPPVLILGATRFVADIYSTYCFSLDSCPAFSLGTGTGAPKIWAIGYIIGLNDVESDVVLKMTRIRGATELANTLQHELGHVVTLGGHRHRRQGDLQPGLMAGREHRRVHRLLGPARHRQCPPSRRAHHRAQRRPPPSIVLGELDDSTSSRASNAYYGLSHFGVDCLALASAKCGLRHPQTAPRQHLRPGVQEGLRRPVAASIPPAWPGSNSMRNSRLPLATARSVRPGGRAQHR